MTNSIVAIDRATGQIGVAVQTCMPAVGATAPWAEPGVGAVATQAFADPAYGPRCLESLRSGATPGESLAVAQAADPMPMLRQVAVIGADGTVAAMTGAACVGHAGHHLGDGFAVQANMASDPDVWPAMGRAFEAAPGSLAWRLLAALRAAEDAGGDSRGRMSAALLVVEGARPDRPGAGIVHDLRVDRSDDPLTGLTNALLAADAYTLFNRFVDQFFRGETASSQRILDEALAVLPEEGNFRFGRVGTLLATGDADLAFQELRDLVAIRPAWDTLFRGFVEKGLMRLPDGLTIDDALATPHGR